MCLFRILTSNAAASEGAGNQTISGEANGLESVSIGTIGGVRHIEGMVKVTVTGEGWTTSTFRNPAEGDR